MPQKILFVDDEQNILDSFRVTLGRRYEVHLALGPEEALRIFNADQTFKVVVTDYQMPAMNGVQLLSQVKDISAKTIRIMLTGHADLDISMSAVNDGHVFRFLTKPCPTELMVNTIEAGLEQYRLLTLEKDLLRNTLLGSINIITEILSLVNPQAFARSDRVRRMVVALSSKLNLKNSLKFELAALLSQIGIVSVPADILTKKFAGQKLNPDEQQSFDLGIETSSQLIKKIPRLDEVGDIILSQLETLNAEEEHTVGGRLLLLALDYDDLILSGHTRDEAMRDLSVCGYKYGANLLEAFSSILHAEDCNLVKEVMLDGLVPGMILAHDLRTEGGSLMLSKGLDITDFILNRVLSLSNTRKIHEPIKVVLQRKCSL